ncbi:hypothetical protein MTP99_000694 [Tenebrio molitor]|jgi:hypothetical protein|nr:hypothetical protein MTP99_000694 [Tenebrio molitor]
MRCCWTCRTRPAPSAQRRGCRTIILVLCDCHTFGVLVKACSMLSRSRFFCEEHKNAIAPFASKRIRTNIGHILRRKKMKEVGLDRLFPATSMDVVRHQVMRIRIRLGSGATIETLRFVCARGRFYVYLYHPDLFVLR